MDRPGTPSRRDALAASIGLVGLLVGGCGRRLIEGQTDAVTSASPDAVTGASQGGGPPTNVVQFEEAARRRLPRSVYEYVRGGKDEEVTLRRNRTAFNELQLNPRALKDVRAIDTTLELFDEKLDLPILLAPTGFHSFLHKDAELETARGANLSRTPLVVSTLSHKSVLEIAEVAKAPLWFQLYAHEDRGITRGLVELGERAGCKALVITVDNPSRGTGAFKKRGLTLPILGNLTALGVDPNSDTAKAFRTDRALDWDAVARIATWTKLPILLKGILAPQDADQAARSGFVAGVIVSNHGARQVDARPATVEALPRVVDSVAGRIPLLVDGGVRYGTDVVKALALGARAVLIGRPYLWGLSVAGADGIATIVETLRDGLELAMMMCGVTSLQQLNRDVLWT
ncbi:MAG: alpha-hydroxy-acid oxidizing protein [Deltaproteobacteria bacterium]|nr:alpha-hydroxy-acid oxidizing protein [Deltaproteobacteria bacterium]